ncbi:hypothetical protein E6R60_05725 [Streptomyces sp. A0642]|uniref:hypothetical protein n=1 Tax=Streptomyces sp. A0642 TaxID=2563100 RepID=UPI0010A276C8|nr:hypothetical protein [Streptomyces sp. A0642]THA78384.1 hypothetical protein E6R60_05725 [Streptomyces sp. A0642]
MTTTHDTIATAILGTVPGARRNLTRITVEHAYAPYGHSTRDTWSGSIDGLMDRIDVALEKTTPPGAEVTAAVTTARTVVLTALARALREQPTAGRVLDGLDELGEAVVQEDQDAARSWVDGISLLVGLPTAPDTGLTYYRASHESIVVGRYTTEAVARRRCESLLSDEHPEDSVLLFDWIGDESEPEEPWELTVQVDGGDEQPTGYVVHPLRIEAEFDPDAEW